MTKLLGIDLGTGSIGWAVIEKDGNQYHILGIGSRIFQPTVEGIGKGDSEKTSNAQRREARGIRRLYRRRRYRKISLLKILSKHGLCPCFENDFQNWINQDDVKTWFKLNPYELRKKALDSKISLHELGRIFYLMVQRRGFLSNSRNAQTSDKSTIMQGDKKLGKIGINQTKEKIQSQNKRTLGEYLAELDTQEERIRNRFTSRDMFIEEVDLIWEKQQKYHTVLTPQLKVSLRGDEEKDSFGKKSAIFFQRPLRSQKSKIGYCSLEPKKRRIPISSPYYERFQVWQTINSIKVEHQPLSEEERQSLFKILFNCEKIKVSALKKKLKLENSAWNYEDKKSFTGCQTICAISKAFQTKADSLSEKDYVKLWNALFDFDDSHMLKDWVIKHFNLDEEAAKTFSEIPIKKDYGKLSKKAISYILPYLEQGYLYNDAVALGGVSKALEKPLSQEEIDDILPIIQSGEKGGYIHHLKTHLKKKYRLNDKQLKKLYHHSQDIEEKKLIKKLPVGNFKDDKPISEIRNPVVEKTIFQTRKIVNELIERFGSFDEIHVELARDLKNPKSVRYEIQRFQYANEKFNNAAKEFLEKYKQEPTRKNIEKYKLWKECRETCPYSGKKISASQLFNNDVEVEHIFPKSKTADDSFSNKTLSFTAPNKFKGDRTPFEAFGASPAGYDWDKMKARFKKLFSNIKENPHPLKEGHPIIADRTYKKYMRLISEKINEDVPARMLNDTRYASKFVKNYLSMICHKVITPTGQATARLRHLWGLNNILSDDATKNRNDHRHHAIDAVVIALTTQADIQNLAREREFFRKKTSFPKPWETIFQDVEKAANQILVSHEQKNKISSEFFVKDREKGYRNKTFVARGQLHEESYYGKEGKRRIPISELSFNQIKNIADPIAQRAIMEKLKEHGLELKFDSKNDKEKQAKKLLKSETFFHPNGFKIKSVRVYYASSGFIELQDNLYVEPGNNHHILIYESTDKKGNPCLKEDVVSFFKAVKRKRNHEPLYQLPPDGTAIKFRLRINDMCIYGLHEDAIDWENQEALAKHLFRIQKISSKKYTLRKHDLGGKLESGFLCLQSLGKLDTLVKVTISPTGIISKNDHLC